MTQWKKVKIGDFLKRKRIHVVLDETAKYKLLTVRLYHKGIVLREERSGDLIKSNMYKVSKGDFILSGIDARNGAFGIVPEELDGAIVTNDFWYFDIDESIIKREYFLWLTSTPIFLDACQKASKGETQRIRLQKDKFFNYEINCPTIDYQDEFLSTIIPVIDKINELKTEIESQKSYAKQLRQNILQEAIEGKLTADWREKHPVKKGDPDYDAEALFEKNQAEKQEKGKKQKPLLAITEDEKPFAIPTGWKWVRLGEIGSWAAGATPIKTERKYYLNGSIPWVRTGDLNDALVSEVPEKITNQALQECSVRLNPIGSVLIAMYGATIGRVGLLSIPATTNQACCACIPFQKDFNQYLFYLLIALRKYFKEKSWGAAQPNISKEIIINTIFPLPPQAEQKEIVARVEKHLETITQLEAQIATRETLTKQLMQSILKDAFEV